MMFWKGPGTSEAFFIARFAAKAKIRSTRVMIVIPIVINVAFTSAAKRLNRGGAQ